MSARSPDHPAATPADTPRTGLLFGGHLVWLLVAILVCGSLVYLVVQEALPTGVALLLGGLAANICALAVLVVDAEREAKK